MFKIPLFPNISAIFASILGGQYTRDDTNLDNTITPGIYLSAALQESGHYSILVVLGNSEHRIQILIEIGGDHFWFRGTNNTNTFSGVSWRKIIATT